MIKLYYKCIYQDWKGSESESSSEEEHRVTTRITRRRLILKVSCGQSAVVYCCLLKVLSACLLAKWLCFFAHLKDDLRKKKKSCVAWYWGFCVAWLTCSHCSLIWEFLALLSCFPWRSVVSVNKDSVLGKTWSHRNYNELWVEIKNERKKWKSFVLSL